MASSLYIHIPFCTTKCYYCAFNTYTFHKVQAMAYLQALQIEMELYAPMAAPLRTIFIGGGTPSILSTSDLTQIFANLQTYFDRQSDTEITVECNPGTVDREKLKILQGAGVNRLSFGVQAMQDETLTQLGRIHTVADFLQSYHLAHECGFENINIDLIFALPKQTLETWQHTLTAVLALKPAHISVYNLVMEEATPFYEWWKSGTLHLPTEDTEADMFQYAIDTLTRHGYEHYEICNFARPNRFARHNLVYWNNQAHIGLGAGAYGYIDGVRYSNMRGIINYMDALRQGIKPIADSEKLTGRAEKAETLMLGFRKREGISLVAYRTRFGELPKVEFGELLEKWKSLKLLECSTTHLRLTARGLFIANELFMELL